MQLHNPFILQGSEILLWYCSERTEKAVILSEEGFVWGVSGHLVYFAYS